MAHTYLYVTGDSSERPQKAVKDQLTAGPDVGSRSSAEMRKHILCLVAVGAMQLILCQTSKTEDFPKFRATETPAIQPQDDKPQGLPVYCKMQIEIPKHQWTSFEIATFVVSLLVLAAEVYLIYKANCPPCGSGAGDTEALVRQLVADMNDLRFDLRNGNWEQRADQVIPRGQQSIRYDNRKSVPPPRIGSQLDNLRTGYSRYHLPSQHITDNQVEPGPREYYR
ncbi:uncharacterized protein LOC129584333 [Paramacrobiotus metropolitanus]|uniref:uncharacterized protein LOC129584333 n=1 Tax=Paramacrobiotus metropolitanus TaxID=2943436 RepID=UPI0024458ED8|nr:uncharacterized protein LOC129584333 [Paramacrobiotus metropolitanus]